MRECSRIMWGMDLLTGVVVNRGPTLLVGYYTFLSAFVVERKTALLLLMVAVSVVYRVHVFVCQNAS